MGNYIRTNIADLRVRLRRLRSEAASSSGWTRDRIIILSTMVDEIKEALGSGPALVQLEDVLANAVSSDERLNRLIEVLAGNAEVLESLNVVLDRWPQDETDGLSEAVASLRSRILSLENNR